MSSWIQGFFVGATLVLLAFTSPHINSALDEAIGFQPVYLAAPITYHRVSSQYDYGYGAGGTYYEGLAAVEDIPN